MREQRGLGGARGIGSQQPRPVIPKNGPRCLCHRRQLGCSHSSHRGQCEEDPSLVHFAPGSEAARARMQAMGKLSVPCETTIIGSRSLVKRRAERNINVYIVVITAKLHEAGTREHTFGAGLEKDQNRRQIAFPLPCPMFTILCPRGKHQG